MIVKGSILHVSDNSGAKKVRCIGTIGYIGNRPIPVGTVIRISVVRFEPNLPNMKKGKKFYAVIVRSCFGVKRQSGEVVRSDDNAVVLLNDDRKTPVGTRVSGIVFSEVRARFPKLASISKGVI